jgi:segregation and condensation protein B
MDTNDLRAALEAILFMSNEPVRVDDLAEAFSEEGREAVQAQLDEIKRALDANVGGFMLEQTAGGWRLATRPDHADVLKKYFAKKGENRLSIAALETLAIVAYRQPITAPEVSDIRSVNSNGVIRTLLERRMIRVAGRKNVVGSPFLYRTTKDFLVHFGLNDIRDLPRLEEFGDLIGEAMNEDLVSAIENAPESVVSADQITEPATTEEAAAAEAAALDELAGASSSEGTSESAPTNDEAPQEMADARKLTPDEAAPPDEETTSSEE